MTMLRQHGGPLNCESRRDLLPKYGLFQNLEICTPYAKPRMASSGTNSITYEPALTNAVGTLGPAWAKAAAIVSRNTS